MDVSNVLTDEARNQGFSLNEPDDDHILELRQYGKVIARFSQTGVEVDSILKQVQQLSKN